MVENVSFSENWMFLAQKLCFWHCKLDFDVYFRIGQDEQKNLIQDFLDKRNMMTLVLYLTPAGVLTADEESPPSSKTKVRTLAYPYTNARTP